MEDRRWWQIEYKEDKAWVRSDLVDAHWEEEQIIPVVSDIPPGLQEPGTGEDKSQGSTIRFKFVWYRDLREGESVDLRAKPINGSDWLEYPETRKEIVAGGGEIRQIEDGVYWFEVNMKFPQLPEGVALWKVAIVEGTKEGPLQLSPWSEERRIVIK
jgi:hypothetical protein